MSFMSKIETNGYYLTKLQRLSLYPLFHEAQQIFCAKLMFI